MNIIPAGTILMPYVLAERMTIYEAVSVADEITMLPLPADVIAYDAYIMDALERVRRREQIERVSKGG